MESKRILLTGGAGFIGYSLYKALSSHYEMIVIDKKNKDGVFNKESINYIKGDLSEQKTFEKVKDKVDIMLHFGSHSSIISFKDHMIDKSTEVFRAFLNVLEFGKKMKIEKLVYPSSGTVYGGVSTSVEKILRPTNIYGAMKLIHEILAAQYDHEFSTIGLRIFMGYGPGEETKNEIASPVFQFLKEMLTGKSPIIWGDGRQNRDLVFIDDIKEIVSNILLQDITTPHLDVGSGVSTSFLDIVDIINQVLHTNISPTFVSKPKGYLEESKANPYLALNILGKPFVRPKEGISRFANYLQTIAK